MASTDYKVSRRQALVGIGLASATAVVPTAGAGLAKSAQIDRTAWDAGSVDMKRLEPPMQSQSSN